MLVLCRHVDEEIVLNNNIVITVVDIRVDKVRIGADAPSEISIHRREVLDAIKREGGLINPVIFLSLPVHVRAEVEKMAADRKMEVGAMLSKWITASVEQMTAQAG